MIGRASHGAPWIFRAVNAQLSEGIATAALLRADVRDIILAHLDSLYVFYGEETGVRIARKHLGWYCEQLLEIPGTGTPGSDGGRRTQPHSSRTRLNIWKTWVSEAAVAA